MTGAIPEVLNTCPFITLITFRSYPDIKINIR